MSLLSALKADVEKLTRIKNKDNHRMSNVRAPARLLAVLSFIALAAPLTVEAEEKSPDTIKNAVSDPIGDQEGTDLDLRVINAFTNGTNLVVEMIMDQVLNAPINGAIFIDTDQNTLTGNFTTFSNSCPNGIAATGAEFIVELGLCSTTCDILDDQLLDTGADAKAEFDGNRLIVTTALADLGNDDGIADIEVLVGTGSQPSAAFSDCGPGNRSVESNATLTADYQFDGNFFSQTLNAPDATETRVSSAFSTENVLGTVRPVRTFSAGNGLRIDPTNGLISDSVYTIQMTIQIDDVTGGGSNFVKLIDFSDSTSDNGLYVISSGGAGLLSYFDGQQSFGVAGSFPENQWAQVVLTRDIDRNITAYIDGVEQFTYQAIAGNTDVSGPLVFLDDDSATSSSEISAGAIACLRIYPTAMDEAQVAELDCELPRRVGLNGNACAYPAINEAVAAAQSGDEIFIEAGYYNERIGLIFNKKLVLRGAVTGSDCAQALPTFSFSERPVVDGAGFTGFVGTGGMLDINNSDVELVSVDLTNGTTGQGGLVTVRPGSSFSAEDSSLSYGTASSDLVNPGLFPGFDEPAGGCIYAQDANVSLSITSLTNCRVLGPNGGQDPSNGDGGAIHARSGSTISTISGGLFTFISDNSARNGGAIALSESSANLFEIDFARNNASRDGGAVKATDSVVTFGFNSSFQNNSATRFGGAVSQTGQTLEITDAAVFRNNSAGSGGGAIDVLSGDLRIRPSSDEFFPALFISNSAGSIGGAINLESVTDVLPNPTIEGVKFEGNSADDRGGALAFIGTTGVDVVDSTFSGNSADLGGAVYSEDSSSTFRSSDTCKAFRFANPDEYCSQLLGNTAGSGSAIYYRANSLENKVLTTAFVGNSGPNTVEVADGGSAGPSAVAMESVWFFANLGDAVVANGSSAYQVVHGTFDNNSGSAFIGTDTSSLTMLNSIAFGNAGGGVTSVGAGPVTVGCNIDQSGLVGLNIDPLFVDSGDGASHLDLLSPAVDACNELATLEFDLEGRARSQRSAPDMGAFEFSDVLFENGFESQSAP